MSSDPYPPGEELASSVTHGLGAVLAVAGLAVLVTFAALRGSATHVVACTVFGATLILMYVASTLYHSIPHAAAKRILQALDHSAIYLVIAGTYTPFMLISVGGALGWSLLALVWAAAIGGIALRAACGRRGRAMRVVLYVLMGWVGVVALGPLAASLGPAGTWFLVGGGVAYTLGVPFYGWSRLPYNHAIWHVFVLAGSALHFFAVLLHVIPWPGR